MVSDEVVCLPDSAEAARSDSRSVVTPPNLLEVWKMWFYS